MQSMQNFDYPPKTTQLRFKHHRVIQNLPIGYFRIPDQNMQFNAKYAKKFFRPKRPSSVLSITESFRTSSLIISVFQIKICDFMQNMQIFDFLYRKAQLRFKHYRVIQNPLIGYFDVPGSKYAILCKYAKYPLFVQNVQGPYQVSHSYLELPQRLFWCSRSNMPFQAKYAKF